MDLDAGVHMDAVVVAIVPQTQKCGQGRDLKGDTILRLRWRRSWLVIGAYARSDVFDLGQHGVH